MILSDSQDQVGKDIRMKLIQNILLEKWLT